MLTHRVARKNIKLSGMPTCVNGSNIAKRAWSFNHCIDFVIVVSSRKAFFTLEKPWHADNNSKPIPNQYSILLNNSHPIYTFILCFCSSYFYLTFSFLSLSRGGLMVNAHDSGVSSPGSSPDWGHCAVFLTKTLYSHGASLHPGTYK